ncbi:MAG: hypothetical protein IJM37_01960 [Lachnospiraceae bacterium]|nr:hypothetical protein [Lachnospiraceae bacterium]
MSKTHKALTRFIKFLKKQNFEPIVLKSEKEPLYYIIFADELIYYGVLIGYIDDSNYIYQMGEFYYDALTSEPISLGYTCVAKRFSKKFFSAYIKSTHIDYMNRLLKGFPPPENLTTDTLSLNDLVNSFIQKHTILKLHVV